MEHETRFLKHLVDTAELADLVTRMAKMAGVQVATDEIIVISTDDAEFSGVLDTLASGLIRNAPKTLEKRERKTRQKKTPKVEKRLGLHSYRNEATGEIWSKQKINRAMAAGELSRGATFVNGHNEIFVVSRVDDDPTAPLRLVIIGE